MTKQIKAAIPAHLAHLAPARITSPTQWRPWYEHEVRTEVTERYGCDIDALYAVQVAWWREDLDPSEWHCIRPVADGVREWIEEARAAGVPPAKFAQQLGCYVS